MPVHPSIQKARQWLLENQNALVADLLDQFPDLKTKPGPPDTNWCSKCLQPFPPDQLCPTCGCCPTHEQCS